MTYWGPIVLISGGLVFISGLESIFIILTFFIWFVFFIGLSRQKKKQYIPARRVQGIFSASITGLFASGITIFIDWLILSLFLLQYTWLHHNINSSCLAPLVFGTGYQTNVTFSLISPLLLFTVLTNSVLVALPHGWLTFVQRLWLYLFLRDLDYIPKNCYELFDYAVERVLLRKSGDGWAFYHRLLQEHFTIQNPDDKISIGALSELAGYYNEQDQHEQALILLQRALKRCEQQKPLEESLLFVLLNNLSWTYQNLGNPEDALPFALRSVIIREQRYGSGNEVTNFGLWRLAEIYYDLECYEKAEPIYERTLIFYKQHDYTGIAVQILGKLVDIAQRKVDLAQSEVDLAQRKVDLAQRNFKAGNGKIKYE